MKDETRFLTINNLLKEIVHWKANHAVLKERCEALRTENRTLISKKFLLERDNKLLREEIARLKKAMDDELSTLLQ